MKNAIIVTLLCVINSYCFLSCTNKDKKTVLLVNNELAKTLVNPEIIDIIDQTKLFKLAKSDDVIDEKLKSEVSGCGMSISFFRPSLNVTQSDLSPSDLSYKEFRDDARKYFQNSIMYMDSICEKNKIYPSYYAAKYKIRVKDNVGNYKIFEIWYFFNKDIDKIEDSIYLE